MKKINIVLIGAVLITFVLIVVLSKLSPTVYNTVGSEDLIGDVTDKIDDINWDDYNNYEVELDGSTYNISKPGIYTLNGNISDGMISVNTSGNVKIILNGVNITNSTGPAIYVLNANNVEISSTSDTTNVLKDGNTYNGFDTEVDGCIYSKSDLILSGNGTIYVYANYSDGIVSKDDLEFNGGTYYIDSKDDAIRGKDSVVINAGDFNITSLGVGIKSTNDEDSERGFVLIKGGTIKIDAKKDGINASNYVVVKDGNITINSSDDGIHADYSIVIDDGTTNISKSYEGLEASEITINGGVINIVASDDGINVAGGVNGSNLESTFKSSSNKLTINGGVISVNANGDGLDANGSIYINGGTITVDGPTNNGNGTLDYDGEFKISGGSLIGIGSSGMAMGASSSSTQISVLINFDSTYSANTTVSIKDETGNEVASYTSKKSFSSLVVSNSKMENNKTYYIYVNGKEYKSFTVQSTSVIVGNTMNMGVMMTNPNGNDRMNDGGDRRMMERGGMRK